MSAETLYVRAGILDECSPASGALSVVDAIAADSRLTDRQRQVLVDVYRSFVETADEPRTAPATGSAPVGDVAPEPTVTPEPTPES